MNEHVARMGEKKMHVGLFVCLFFAMEAEGNRLLGRSRSICGKPILN